MIIGQHAPTAWPPGQRPSTLFTGGWVGVEKISYADRASNFGVSNPQRVAVPNVHPSPQEYESMTARRKPCHNVTLPTTYFTVWHWTRTSVVKGDSGWNIKFPACYSHGFPPFIYISGYCPKIRPGSIRVTSSPIYPLLLPFSTVSTTTGVITEVTARVS